MYNDQLQKFRRQRLRKNQTEAEKILWENAGVHIIRFWNQEIINNLESALENITNSNARNPSLVIREGPSEAKSG